MSSISYCVIVLRNALLTDIGPNPYLGLDQAVLRRFQKRIMIPLPLMPNRQELLSNLLKKSKNSITCEQLKEIARLTEGYSGSDLTQLTKDAAMTPLREMTSQQITRY